MQEGMAEIDAEVTSQKFNIVAMVLFCCSRFICTFILRFFNAGQLLMILAIAGGCFTAGVIALHNIWGLYCLVAVSACMSLMFPTIFAGIHHRYAYRIRNAIYQCVVHSSIHLFRGDCHLWISH